MSVSDPRTFEELMAYIERYCADIYVRDFVNGDVGSYSLVELPVSRALHHAFRWLRNAQIPTRLISDQEYFERDAADAPDTVEPPPTETA